MNFLTAIQADRLITQIREESDPTSPVSKKAIEKLARLGNAAVPKILEAMASCDKRLTGEYVGLLSSLIDDRTLPVVTRGLAASGAGAVGRLRCPQANARARSDRTRDPGTYYRSILQEAR